MNEETEKNLGELLEIAKIRENDAAHEAWALKDELSKAESDSTVDIEKREAYKLKTGQFLAFLEMRLLIQNTLREKEKKKEKEKEGAGNA